MPEAGEALRRRPLVVLFFFQTGPDRIYLRDLLNAARAAQMPADATVYVGTYGPNREVAHDIIELRSGRYALPFSIRPSTSR